VSSATGRDWGDVALWVAVGMLGPALVGPVAPGSGVARADGAFPASQSILLPVDRPRQIVVAATFGLVFTDDDAATWQYACEVPETRNGRQYALGPPPGDTIHAVSEQGATLSTDDSCTWRLGAGALAGWLVSDVFPDRVDPMKVFALAAPETTDISVTSAFKSVDGGLTYGAPIFTPPQDAIVTGIESAVSAPGTLYLTYYETPGSHPRLMVSTDDGATFMRVDLEPALGAVWPFIAAVDPADARKLYLRLVGQGADGRAFEALAISTDAGGTWTTPLVGPPSVALSGFLRRQSGTLLALLNDPVGSVVSGRRSTDGGVTFVDWPMPLHARGIAERGDTLFVAAEDILDGAALWSSSDEGVAWQPRLRFQQIGGVRPCVRQICAADCDYYSDLNLFPKSVCTAEAGPNPPAKPGCGCALGPGPRRQDGRQDEGVGAVAVTLLLGVVGWGLVRRRRGPTTRVTPHTPRR